MIVESFRLRSGNSAILFSWYGCSPPDKEEFHLDRPSALTHKLLDMQVPQQVSWRQSSQA